MGEPPLLPLPQTTALPTAPAVPTGVRIPGKGGREGGGIVSVAVASDGTLTGLYTIESVGIQSAHLWGTQANNQLTDRQAGRQTDRQTDEHTGRKTNPLVMFVVLGTLLSQLHLKTFKGKNVVLCPST